MEIRKFVNEDVGDSLEAFDKLVGSHDLTYSYSDDHRYWTRGEESIRKIRAMQERLVKQDPENKKKCAEIWNKWVDKKINAKYASDWYWEEK
jgi:hypothetical protein